MTTQAVQLVVLEPLECRRLLLQHQIGRVAVTIGRQPHIVPVTYAADADGNVVFRMLPAGSTGSTFECQFDTAPLAACTSPVGSCE